MLHHGFPHNAVVFRPLCERIFDPIVLEIPPIHVGAVIRAVVLSGIGVGVVVALNRDFQVV
jgi:hypothetical protein